MFCHIHIVKLPSNMQNTLRVFVIITGWDTKVFRKSVCVYVYASLCVWL